MNTPAADGHNPLRRLTLADLRSKQGIKWRRYPEDVLPLWIADMDAVPPTAVVDAVNEALGRGDTGYPPFDPAFAHAWDHFASLRWGWRVDPDRTLVVPSVLTGITETLKVITAPGDAVVVNSPGYGPHLSIIRGLGRRPVEVPLGPGHRIDLDALRAAFSDGAGGGRPGALLLCSPHNPTGTVHTAAELTAVAELAGEFGVRVLTNEIHAPLVPAGARHVPYLSVPGSDDAVSVFSASKGWHLSGFRGGLLAWGADSGPDMRRIPMDMLHELSGIGVIAQTAALNHGIGWLDHLLVGLDENRRLLAELLADRLPEIRHRQPEGTYLAWLDCRELNLGDDPAAAFLERSRVALTPGPEFGRGGEGHVRLNFATSPEILTDAVHRMAKVRDTPSL
ncbi:aminotransferase class I/II-fold pyridoxal phosphate-dependent enzyme [Streptomyces sp. me109]|uniref:MalY/PatB family protein n=1 Tax=Streptomyces sp. me109 TaxID=1827853 RepID=UPI0011CE9998|nr:aminotransferase class I/II-fold pyridoxal phosphate-dependent enzyme [Streptomyces sp. me109]TXS69591.1 aminotransferase class I/II-fold pyridoxal phosphate-dependent enzyme [Streptomyces sp. me109]